MFKIESHFFSGCFYATICSEFSVTSVFTSDELKIDALQGLK